MLTVAFRVILQGLANLCPSDALRSTLYRWYGVQVGEDVFIGANVSIDRQRPEWIEIGDRAAIGMNTIITAHQDIPTHTGLRRLYPSQCYRTHIEHDVWIMPGVIVVPGVTIGHHAVIATGVVVHKDVPPYSVVVGPGCRVAKELDPSDVDEPVASLDPIVPAPGQAL